MLSIFNLRPQRPQPRPALRPVGAAAAEAEAGAEGQVHSARLLQHCTLMYPLNNCSKHALHNGLLAHAGRHFFIEQH